MRSAEAAVLGLILHNPVNLGLILSQGISPTDFFDSSLERIFEEMLQAEVAGRSITAGALAVALPGNASLLAELLDEAPIGSDVAYYGNELLRASWARRLGAHAQRVAAILLRREAFADQTGLEEAANELSLALIGSPTVNRGGARHARPVLIDAVTEVEDTIKLRAAGERPGFSTGLPKLDDLVMGLRGGWYYVLGARTGVGKTTLGLQIAAHVAMQQQPVLYVTNEMPDTDLAHKLTSSEARVSLQALLNGDLTEDETYRVVKAATELSGSGLWIDHKTRGDMDTIELATRVLHRRTGLSLLVIDYIQQLRIRGQRFATRTDELSEISGRVKQIALDLKIPVLVLAQINREAPKSTNAEPQIWQLRDSGALEQDADCIMLLHPDKDDEATTWLTVAKNRRGQKGKIRLDADLAMSKFREAAPRTYANGTPLGR